jgi:multisubunit Na+/H+ antiporter MnhG subunit
MILLQETQDAVTSGWQLFNNLSWKFFNRLAVDLLSVFILIRFIYYPSYKTREMFFTFFIFNLIIFLVIFMMNKVQMSIGAGFGLFAVFGIMRYRTEDVSTKDMTYLFLSIAMGMITAVTKGGWDELLLINGIILIVTLLLETNILMKKELGKTIQYENIEMIKPENQQKLLDDLKMRTGLDVHRFSITKIDFLRDMATIRIYYYDKRTNKDISV